MEGVQFEHVDFEVCSVVVVVVCFEHVDLYSVGGEVCFGLADYGLYSVVGEVCFVFADY